MVSCSQFEAHAGRGARRAPYDFIFTEEGISLRRLAERLPAQEGEAAAAPLVARKVLRDGLLTVKVPSIACQQAMYTFCLRLVVFFASRRSCVWTRQEPVERSRCV